MTSYNVRLTTRGRYQTEIAKATMLEALSDYSPSVSSYGYRTEVVLTIDAASLRSALVRVIDAWTFYYPSLVSIEAMTTADYDEEVKKK